MMSPTVRRLVMALLLLTTVGFVRLGVWQVGRLHQRRATNVGVVRARAAAPATLPPIPADPEALAEHWVVASGRYDHTHEIVIRGDVLQGVPGVRLVTPLVLEPGGPAVLVDRGFLPAPDAVTVDLHGSEEPGELTVRGIALPIPAGPGEPVDHGGRTTWRRLALAEVRERLSYPVLPIYLRQSPDSALPKFPRREELPPLDDGPHLSYAIQWFLFAGMALAFAVLVVWRGGR
ncbi:MAG: SURF1 family protein [Gemmatimonadales bacterium]